MKEQRSQRVMRLARERSDRIALSAIRKDEKWGGCPEKTWTEWHETANQLNIDNLVNLSDQFGIEAVSQALAKIEEKSGKPLMFGGQNV